MYKVNYNNTCYIQLTCKTVIEPEISIKIKTIKIDIALTGTFFGKLCSADRKHDVCVKLKN